MTGLTDPIRIETATFSVHQVSHKIPLMLECRHMVRVIRLAPLPFSFPSRSLGLLVSVGEPRDTGMCDDGFGSRRSMLIRWVSTEIRRSEISKKDLEVDGFGTIANLL